MGEEQEVVRLDFSGALALMKSGGKVTRIGWNGAKLGMSMFVAAQFPDENSANTNPYFYMVVGSDRTPWHPSNLDLFATDWEFVA